MEIPESLPSASMLNQNTDTYNDYLGEMPREWSSLYLFPMVF